MNKTLVICLKTLIVFIAIGVIFILLRFPMLEGRAKNLDLFSIYSDPFILFGYFVSVFFFVGLFYTFKLLGYFGQNELHSIKAIKSVRIIKNCAIVFAILIVLAGLFIKFFHHKDDDPAGFLVISFLVTVISLLFAFVVAKFEKRLKKIVALD